MDVMARRGAGTAGRATGHGQESSFVRDVVSAFTGSILLLLGLWLWQKRG